MAFGALKNLFKEDVEDEEELYEPEDYDDVEEEPKASKSFLKKGRFRRFI